MAPHNQGWLAREQRRLAHDAAPQQQPAQPAQPTRPAQPDQPAQPIQPQPSAQQWPAQYPHNQQPHSDSQIGAPHGYGPGVAPQEGGPQR